MGHCFSRTHHGERRGHHEPPVHHEVRGHHNEGIIGHIVEKVQ